MFLFQIVHVFWLWFTQKRNTNDTQWISTAWYCHYDFVIYISCLICGIRELTLIRLIWLFYCTDFKTTKYVAFFESEHAEHHRRWCTSFYVWFFYVWFFYVSPLFSGSTVKQRLMTVESHRARWPCVYGSCSVIVSVTLTARASYACFEACLALNCA